MHRGLEDGGGDLGADAVLWPALLQGDEPVCLVDRLNDGLAVERPDAAQVNDLAGAVRSAGGSVDTLHRLSLFNGAFPSRGVV